MNPGQARPLMTSSPTIEQIQETAHDRGLAMRRHCFDGDFTLFHSVFNRYLLEHSANDPHARLLLEKQIDQPSGLLSFRSTSTDRHEMEVQLKARWDAWTAVLPLDLQLHLLIMEASPHDHLRLDPANLKWEQWRAIRASPDPNEAYVRSALAQAHLPRQASKHKTTSPGAWDLAQSALASSTRQHAMQLVAWKMWDDLEKFMQASSMHACEATIDLYIHYKKEFSRGSTRATARQPLPFWATGLFCGATEPQFWAVMGKFGGPHGPDGVFQEKAMPSDAMLPAPRGQALVDFPVALGQSPPLSWVETFDTPAREALALLDRTHAQWTAQSMHADVVQPTSARKGSARL